MRKNVIKGIILGTIVLFASPINTLAADMYSIGNVNIRSTSYGAVIY